MKTKKSTGESPVAKSINNLIIVDESGSMGIIRYETLAGINETITTCQQMQKKFPDMEQRITLITFDSTHFCLHYDNVKADDAKKLNTKDYQPSGGTPLYDAIGKGVAKLNAQTKADDKVLVTIITDGEENCSEEYNLNMVKNLIEKLKKQGWTFTLIGTENLDVEGMAGNMSIDNHLQFTEDAVSTEKMFASERKARARYNMFCCTEAPMPVGSYFDDEDKK